MGHGRPTAGALVLSASLLPALTVADSAVATASARITLQIPPQVQLRPVTATDRAQLCVGRIPARHYYLEITDDTGTAARQLPGMGGSYCLPSSATTGAVEVMIVAQ